MGKKERRKGRDGRAAFVRLLKSRDWEVEKTRDGIIADDLVACDRHGQHWSIEVKNTRLINLTYSLKQAKTQAKARDMPWMLAHKIFGSRSWLVLRQEGRTFTTTTWEEG